MHVLEQSDGSQWADTHYKRQLNRLTTGDAVWFVLGHLLLIPLALAVLALTALSLPLYWLWARRRNQYPHETETHGEVGRILDALTINEAFIIGSQPDATPDISVVMPFYNRAGWVASSVGSVLGQVILPGVTVELIAVDNGSTDETIQELERYPVRIIHCAKRGPGAARNAGIEAARAPIVAFIDSDCVADSFWLTNITAAFKDPETLVAGGLIFGMEDDQFVSTFATKEHLLDNARFFEGGGYFPPFFATANAAFKREALLKVEGFDNNLWMSEDADLAWRVMDLGGKMALMPHSVVYHHHRDHLRGFFKQSIDYGAASVAVFAKHRDQLEARAAFSWKNLRDIAWSPFQIIWDQFSAETPFDHNREFLYALWRLGFTFGSVRECIRRRVFFL